jgi:hypothetical protein
VRRVVGVEAMGAGRVCVHCVVRGGRNGAGNATRSLMKENGSTRRTMLINTSYLLGPVLLLFENVCYLSLRDLRQQMPNLIYRASLRRGYELWANRTRLPELDQETIEFQPLLKFHFCGSPDLGGGPGEGKVERYMNCDLLKVLVLGCDGLERNGNPFFSS